MDRTSSLWLVSALFFTALLYVLLKTLPSATVGAVSGWIFSPRLFIGGTLIGLGFALSRLPFSVPLLILICLVPFEFSRPIDSLPSLSPIDYVCAATMAVWMIRHWPQTYWTALRRLFGPVPLGLWFSFILFACISARLTGGNIRGVLRWGEYLFVYLIAREAAEFDRHFLESGVCWLLSALGAGISAIAIYQFFTAHMDYEKVVGTFGQHNIIGAFLSLCLPGPALLVLQGFRKSAVPALLLILAAIAVTYSRGAWVGLVLGILAILIIAGAKHRWGAVAARRFLTALLVAIPLLGIVLPLGLACHQSEAILAADNNWVHQAIVWSALHKGSASPSIKDAKDPTRDVLSLSQRPMYWQAAWTIFGQHPFAGLGPGNYPSQIQYYLGVRSLHLYRLEMETKKFADFWQHLHSLYLQTLAEYGLVGILIWLAAYYSIILPAAYRSIPALRIAWGSLFCLAGVIGFLAHNTVDIVTVNSLDLLFATYLALLRSSSS